MAEIASAHVSIYPKFASGFADGVKKEVGTAGTKGGTAFSTGFNKAVGGKSGGGGLGGAAIGGLKAGLIGLAATVSFGAISAGFQNVTGAASDLSETVNKSKVIFGDQFTAMDAWASGSAKSMGISKQAALEAASGFGNMFTQLGFTGTAAADMSRQVMQMSTDMGSFNNLPTAQVADMISAAFRGEYDSLQRLVPTINAAAVEQEAMAMTGKKNAKQLTQQEKAAATMSLVTKGASVAMGDFANTAEGAANKGKTNAARIDDLKAAFGGLLGPIQKVANEGFEQLISAGEGFTAWLEKNPEVIAGFAAALSLAGDALGALGTVAVPVFYVLVEGFAQVMDGVAAFLRALGTVPGFEWATDAAEKVATIADGAHTAAKGLEDLAKGEEVAKLEAAALTQSLNLIPELVEAEVLAPGAKPSKAEVDDFIRSLGTIPAEKKAEIIALANTYGVQQVKDAMASVHDKTVTISIKQVYLPATGVMKAAAGADGGAVSPWAISPLSGLALAAGGRVPGWSAHDRADNIPAWLTAGEFVHPVSAVEHYGMEAMEAVRRKRATITYADGGRVGSPGAFGKSADEEAFARAFAAALSGAELRLTGAVDTIGDAVSARILLARDRGV